jgi:4-hydroxy-tetrahydrodipicolinate synthase
VTEDAQTVELRGAMISVATPATSKQEIDEDAYRNNLRFMLDHGATTGRATFLVAAAGGEFPMLSTEQRKLLMRVAVETAGHAVPIIASVQSNSTREAVELASYAREVGVTAGQLSAPSYYPPTPADILRFFHDVAETGLPIIIYNNWWNTTNMNVETVEDLAGVPGIVGLKWSTPGLEEYIEGYRRFADRLLIIDNAMNHLTASHMGAVGFITHVGNFWPEYPLALWDLMQSRDADGLVKKLDFKWQWRRWAERVASYTEGEGPFIKAAMEEVGLPTGDPFLPSLPVPTELRSDLSALFRDFEVPRTGSTAVAAS